METKQAIDKVELASLWYPRPSQIPNFRIRWSKIKLRTPHLLFPFQFYSEIKNSSSTFDSLIQYLRRRHKSFFNFYIITRLCIKI
jgi:hypothetical protein